MLAKLQRRLDNDEPKCANCGYWRRGEGIEDEPPSAGICTLPSNAKERGLFLFVTTDLSVCSRWEQKPDKLE